MNDYHLSLILGNSGMVKAIASDLVIINAVGQLEMALIEVRTSNERFKLLVIFGICLFELIENLLLLHWFWEKSTFLQKSYCLFLYFLFLLLLLFGQLWRRSGPIEMTLLWIERLRLKGRSLISLGRRNNWLRRLIIWM